MGRGLAQRTIDLVDTIRTILAEIQPTSVRSVCYQLFARGVLLNMGRNETSRVSSCLARARERGVIPWDWVVDETRQAERVATFRDPSHILQVAHDSYRKDYWAYQDKRVEVWSEKGTVRGVLRPVLDEYAVTFRVFHGYSSATTLHAVAEEWADILKPWVVFYLGDWDPSGLHMRCVDIPKRLVAYGVRNARFTLYHLALNPRDVADPALSSFDAATKRGDSRYDWFTRTYGSRCWELDAMNPNVLRARVAAAILKQIEPEAWERCRLGEAAEQRSLEMICRAKVFRDKTGNTHAG